MSTFFYVENDMLKPYALTLSVSPFREVWERDKSKNKKNAFMELMYCEAVGSLAATNPFREYDEVVRREKARKDIIKIDGWKEDDKVKECIEAIKENESTASAAYEYYKSALIAMEKMQKFYRDFDMNERKSKSGDLVFKPKEITSSISDTEKVITNLMNIKKRLDDDMMTDRKIRANAEISPFADPRSVKLSDGR